MDDVRKDWFMQQHFSPEELQKLFDWEFRYGKVGVVVSEKLGYSLYNCADIDHELCLCFMAEEYMLRRWADRLGYKMIDGKTSEQFEREKGIADPPLKTGTLIFKIGRLSITDFVTHIDIISGDGALVAERTASNAYTLRQLNNKEMTNTLKQKKEITEADLKWRKGVHWALKTAYITVYYDHATGIRKEVSVKRRYDKLGKESVTYWIMGKPGSYKSIDSVLKKINEQ